MHSLPLFKGTNYALRILQIPIQRTSPDMERGVYLLHGHRSVGVEFPGKRHPLTIHDRPYHAQQALFSHIAR